MTFFVERNITNTGALQYCQAAFSNIIDQCIDGSVWWGGHYSYDGETYSLTNADYGGSYENNPFGPWDLLVVEQFPVSLTVTETVALGTIATVVTVSAFNLVHLLCGRLIIVADA